MSYTIPMDHAGRIVLPKPVRSMLGANHATQFKLEVILNRIELTPLNETPPSTQLVKKGGLLVAKKTGKTFSAGDLLVQGREER